MAFSAVTANSATITFTRNATNEDGHIIEVSLDGGFGWREATRTASGASSIAVMNLLPGRTYKTRVRAFNVGGLSAPAIASGSFTTPTGHTQAPATPSNLSVLPASDTVLSVGWMLQSDDEDGIKVYTSTDNNHFTLAKTAPARVGQCYVSGLTAGTTYYVFVAATNSVGDSGETTVVSAATLASGQVISPTGRNPQFVWTPQWQAGWVQAKADYLANTAAPATRGGQYYKEMLKFATDPAGTHNAEFGLSAMMVFQITGTASYATAAIAGLDQANMLGVLQNVTGVTDSQHFAMNTTVLAAQPGGGYGQFRCRFTTGVLAGQLLAVSSYTAPTVTLYAPASVAPSIGDQFYFIAAPRDGLTMSATSANAVRDRLEEVVLMLDWLWPGLSSTDQTRFLYTLDAWIDYARGQQGGYGPRVQPQTLPVPYGASSFGNVTDNDQSLGTYFGLAMYDTLSVNPNAGTLLSGTINNQTLPSNLPVGGLDATGIDNTTLRNGIERIACCQDGGESLDSVEYVWGTLYYPQLGIASLYTALGVEHFPRQRANVIQAGAHQSHQLIPDLSQVMPWGDDEHPHETFPTGQLSITVYSGMGGFAGMCAHVASYGPAAAQLAYTFWQTELAAGYGTYARFYLLQRPDLPLAALSTQPRSHYAPGMGHLLLRDGWSSTASTLFADAHASPTEDHDHHLMGTFDLFRNGEWAITHLVGYWSNGSDRGGAWPESYNAMLLGGMGRMYDVVGPVAEEVGAAEDYGYLACATYGLYQTTGWLPPPSFINEHTRSILYLPDLTGHASDTIVVYDRTMVANPRVLANYPWNPSFSDRPQDATLPALKQWSINTRGTPTLNAGDTSWSTPGGQAVRVSHLLPVGFTRNVYNFSSLSDAQAAWVVTPTGTLGGSGVSFVSSEYTVTPYQVRVIPPVAWPSGTAPAWDEFLNVIQVAGSLPAAPTAVTSTNGLIRATLVHRTGLNDALVGFGASPHGRVLHSGDTIAWTATAPATDLYLFDLDPSKTWSYTIDGGGSTALTVSGQGVARILAVAGSGSHTLILTGN